MPRPPEIPDFARLGPFTRETARTHGVSDRRLQGRQFERLHPGVWRWRGYEMTARDWIIAAQLAMPDRAVVSHVSRIRLAGLDIGPPEPVHLTIAGDHHLAMPGVFLHRTKVMPPRDDLGVTPAVAFIQCCASMTLLELITIGDHLLHHGLASEVEIAELCRLHAWRPGVLGARTVLPHLDGRARSPKESQLRAFVVASGLPVPHVNAPIPGLDGSILGFGDLWFPQQRLVGEYEGRQHAEDIVQFATDIERYAAFRHHDVAYVQVTGSIIANPVGTVHRIYGALVRRGYAGPPPRFGARWGALFQQVSRPRVGGAPSTEWGAHSVEDPPPLAGFG